jgi:hypothetical protein
MVCSASDSKKASEYTGRGVRSEYKYVTYHDYLKIPNSVLFTYDLRSIGKYIIDELVHYHSVIKLVLMDSIISPKLINYIKLTFRINMIFAINAFAFTDNLIEQRANDPSRVSNQFIM